MKSKNEESQNNGFSLFSKWTIRRISFIGILIAISVVFVIISVSIFPIASLPSIKISFIGLPIKISGFIFGPVVGGLVGLISDVISFLFVPSFYNPLYTLATMIDGIVAGIIGWIFLRLFKFYFSGEFRDKYFQNKMSFLYNKYLDLKITNLEDQKVRKLEDKMILLNEKRKKIRLSSSSSTLLNVNLIVAISILLIIIMFIFWLIGKQTSQYILDQGIVKNRWALVAIMCSGYAAMLVFLVLTRLFMNHKKFLVIVPIVIFSALIELINVPLLSLADLKSLSQGENKSIFVFIIQHTFMSPVKIWFNMFVIFFTYNIIASLIYKNNDICY
ncbi:ECF transporter S component [Mycoplasma sp. Mirounga ES2805-ORL]|uniref:ECF transporter S component n=1 Tax=Mycoplasma sp. Mirounga ES2805-ORL TaxID=754514 RepID=UPI00197BA3C1|nr:ECF transporter S component [Mycoplasma sp. Mirounga ES2805-ORL]QSF13573.1 ECF transporter S component [Mycoplasma sp. Mirounga ES2805-ORL]